MACEGESNYKKSLHTALKNVLQTMYLESQMSLMVQMSQMSLICHFCARSLLAPVVSLAAAYCCLRIVWLTLFMAQSHIRLFCSYSFSQSWSSQQSWLSNAITTVPVEAHYIGQEPSLVLLLLSHDTLPFWWENRLFYAGMGTHSWSDHSVTYTNLCPAVAFQC